MLLFAMAGSSAAAADAFDHPWCGFETDAFRLLTDAPEADAAAMVTLLGQFRPVAERYLPGVVNDANPPLTILVFRRIRDFRQAVGGSAMVGFMQPSFTDNLMVVGPDPFAPGEHEALLHEYVHYLLRTRRDINIPTWFDEGLATLLSTARVDAQGMVIGEIPVRSMSRNIGESALSLADVLDAEDLWDWPANRIRGFYDFARLLVHRLTLGQASGQPDWRPPLAAHLSGAEASLTGALNASAGAVERQLRRYLTRTGTVTEPLAHQPAPPAGEFRCLTEPEKVRRLSLAIVQQNPRLAAERLRQTLDRHPDNVDLWIALSLAEESDGSRDRALAAARQAAGLAPEDVAANVRVASALAMGCILENSAECRARWQEAVPLLRSSLRRDPRRHDAVFLLGLAYLYSGRPGDGLNYLRIAHRHQPWAPHLNFYLGESYRLIGDSRASAHLERARRWSTNELWRRLAEAGLERLAATDGEASGD